METGPKVHRTWIILYAVRYFDESRQISSVLCPSCRQFVDNKRLPKNDVRQPGPVCCYLLLYRPDQPVETESSPEDQGRNWRTNFVGRSVGRMQRADKKTFPHTMNIWLDSVTVKYHSNYIRNAWLFVIIIFLLYMYI